MKNDKKVFFLIEAVLGIMVVVLAFNFLGDGLRDVLDPYMKNQ